MSWLRIEKLAVEVRGKLILKDFNLNIEKGEVHVLLGPNGAGKTTLIKTILGFKNYKVVNGHIFFKDKDITNLPTNERIQMGIGVLFQHPPAINGLKLSKLLTVCSEKRGNNTECTDELSSDIQQLATRLKFSPEYINRDVNLGFSGGEVKRSEILQMMVLKPDLLLFDEPDSGVDVENVELIAKIMRELLDRDKIPSKQGKSGLIITHLGYILKFLGHITRAHIMMDGTITCSGDPALIINSIMKNGFEACRECVSCVENSSLLKEVDFTL
ncbi:MAG: ABC transporter ATP-binding protein [Promethearchaeia archaeon]|nr:MAG: ABC transporter ATP-binding protein [Candidatus Lokiarchaeia archaeon]